MPQVLAEPLRRQLRHASAFLRRKFGAYAAPNALPFIGSRQLMPPSDLYRHNATIISSAFN
jgi:hypothetical protein